MLVLVAVLVLVVSVVVLALTVISKLVGTFRCVLTVMKIWHAEAMFQPATAHYRKQNAAVFKKVICIDYAVPKAI
jgi:hypothetical protein